MELKLPGDHPAHYQWLSGVIYIDDASPIDLRRFLELNTIPIDDPSLGGVFDESLQKFMEPMGSLAHPKVWKDSEEAKADLSVRHEFAHYVQDLGTGVGNWDDVMFRSENTGLISLFSNKQDWTSLQEERMTFVDEALEKFLVFVPPRIEARRQRERVSFLDHAGIATLTPAGEVRNFSVANLLEADAVAEVLIHVSDILLHDETASRLPFDKSISYLWNPSEMGPNYRIMFNDLKAAIGTEALRPIVTTSDGAFRAFRLLGSVLQQMVDIALAYPAPSFLNGMPKERQRYFDPVVRYYCMLSAFYEMDEKAGAKMAEWLEDPSFDFEDALLLGSRFRDIYPSRTEIYRGWSDALDAVDENDVLLRARKRSSEGRQEKSVSIRRVPLGSSLVDGYWWRNSKQFPTTRFTTDMETMMDMRAAQTELVIRISDVRILDLLCNGRVKPCMFVGGHCAAEDSICREGFVKPQMLPMTGCLLRSRYQFARV